MKTLAELKSEYVTARDDLEIARTIDRARVTRLVFQAIELHRAIRAIEKRVFQRSK